MILESESKNLSAFIDGALEKSDGPLANPVEPAAEQQVDF